MTDLIFQEKYELFKKGFSKGLENSGTMHFVYPYFKMIENEEDVDDWYMSGMAYAVLCLQNNRELNE